MDVNIFKELQKHIELAKKKNDHMALSFALSEEAEINKVIRSFQEFKKTKQYKNLLKAAVDRFKNIAKERDKNDQFLEEDIKYLKIIETEARRLKI